MNKKRKKQLLTIVVILSFLITGCSNKRLLDTIMTNSEEKGDIEEKGKDAEGEDIECITAVFRNLYKEAIERNISDSLEVIRSVVNRLAENGYSAVDSENKIDLVCPDQIKQFCKQVEAQEEAEATLIVVISIFCFVKYKFTTKAGKVEVLRNAYLYKGKDWEMVSTKKYPAYTWIYSEEGYLFFEEYHMFGFDGPSGHTAIRIEPLDEICRKLNRKYLRTIGYEQNNLFTSDWSEEDFQKLNFYDLYVVLYQMKNELYTSVRFFEEGVTYEIPESEFESVVQTFFRIDTQVLRQYTRYHKETETYQYRERGIFDFASTPNIPYPEVISYKENLDGTIQLTVNAVFPERNLGKAFCHEVIIRPLEDGGFQYVSNHVIPSKDNVEMTWYTERLSDEKWQEYYGGIE